MRPIGFSTGALALDNVTEALRMLRGKSSKAIELSALRQAELEPLIDRLGELDLAQFEYVSFHAPSSIEIDFEDTAVQLLEAVAKLDWHIIVHPNVMHSPRKWASFGSLLCIENMDKRKPIGQTASDLRTIFGHFPKASFCFDVGHARQVDPTMSEAAAMLHEFGDRLVQLHVSEVNTQSKHDPLTLEAKLAINRVAHLISATIPVILESRVPEQLIEAELDSAKVALEAEELLAMAGD